MAIHDHGGLPDGALGNAAGHNAYLRLLLIDPECDNFLCPRKKGQRLFIIGIDHGNPAAREIVAEQLPQLGHALVVERYVQEYPHRRTIQRNRSVTFVDLTDVETLRSHYGARERALR